MVSDFLALKEGEPATQEVKDMKDMIRRAERRWKNADVDGDGSLSKEEFRDFIHPEESQRAGGVAVLEAMEDMDTDRNKEVSLEEYMNHLNKVSKNQNSIPDSVTLTSVKNKYCDKKFILKLS